MQSTEKLFRFYWTLTRNGPDKKCERK